MISSWIIGTATRESQQEKQRKNEIKSYLLDYLLIGREEVDIIDYQYVSFIHAFPTPPPPPITRNN